MINRIIAAIIFLLISPFFAYFRYNFIERWVSIFIDKKGLVIKIHIFTYKFRTMKKDTMN